MTTTWTSSATGETVCAAHAPASLQAAIKADPAVTRHPTAHSQPIPIGAGQYMVRKAGMWEPAHADDRCERCVYVNSVR